MKRLLFRTKEFAASKRLFGSRGVRRFCGTARSPRRQAQQLRLPRLPRSLPRNRFSAGKSPPPWLLAVNFETSTSFCCLRLLMQGALRKPLPSADLTACRRSSKSCGFMDFAEAFGKRRVPPAPSRARRCLASARRLSALPVAFAEDVSRETYQGWRATRFWQKRLFHVKPALACDLRYFSKEKAFHVKQFPCLWRMLRVKRLKYKV